ncbi:hypothetical protein YC2023_067998 [Brassica napus]
MSTGSPSSQLVQVVPDNQNNTGDSSAKVKYEDLVRKSCLLDLLYGIQRFGTFVVSVFLENSDFIVVSPLNLGSIIKFY